MIKTINNKGMKNYEGRQEKEGMKISQSLPGYTVLSFEPPECIT